MNPRALHQRRWRVERFARVAASARARSYIGQSVAAGMLTEQQADKLRRALATGAMSPDSVISALAARWQSDTREDC
jgi:uncharacterized protein (DUF885 family)